jgi:hypothetical protein
LILAKLSHWIAAQAIVFAFMIYLMALVKAQGLEWYARLFSVCCGACINRSIRFLFSLLAILMTFSGVGIFAVVYFHNTENMIARIGLHKSALRRRLLPCLPQSSYRVIHVCERLLFHHLALMIFAFIPGGVSQ